MPANTEIHSVMAGEVISSELHPSYGNTVVVQSGSKQVRYAHMNSAEVSTGDVVKKGDIIQVIYYADKSDDTALRTIPPYADVKIGVFSTRSPHRPNPILIDIARVLDVNDNKITVEGLDALDGSPILDIKGYSRKLHDNLMQKYIHELI